MVPGEVSLETLRVSQAVWMGQTLMLISSMEAFPQPRQRKQLFSIAAEVPPGEASVPCVADGSFNKSRFWHFRVCSSADTKPGMDSLSGLQTQARPMWWILLHWLPRLQRGCKEKWQPWFYPWGLLPGVERWILCPLCVYLRWPSPKGSLWAWGRKQQYLNASCHS